MKPSRNSIPRAQHALTWCVVNRLGDRPKSEATAALNVRPQTFYIMLRRCKVDHTVRIPAAWARPLARFFKVTPHFLRPDLFAESWRDRELV